MSITLQIEEGRTKAFCSYCGAQILVSNENEHIYRHIDEARITEAEARKAIRLKELELEEAQLKKQTVFVHPTDHTRKVLTYVWLAVSLVLLSIAIGLMLSKGNDDTPGWAGGFLFLFYACAPIIGGGAYLVFKFLPEKEYEKELLRAGGVRFPKGLEPFSESTVEAVQKSLAAAGFANVTCISKHDVVLGLFQKAGKIETISVDGKEITAGGHVYLPSAQIIITYHGR